MPLSSQIRHAVINGLKKAALWQGKVFESPLQPLNPDQLPVLMVTVEKDQVLDDWTSLFMTTLASNALICMHELLLAIKIVVKATDQAMDEIEIIISQIKTVLLSDTVLKPLCKDIRFYELSDATAHEDGIEPIRASLLRVGIWYRIVESLPHAPYP